MARLIVNHGERVTEHELGDGGVFIGRDPECDLFFADKKLSRRHAKVEPSGTGFKLVDLESRNGSWVNEERVEERQLLDGDEIRLGGLKIYFELESPELTLEDEGDESTVYLPRVAASPETEEVDGTIALGGAVVPGAPPSPLEDGTVMLPPDEPLHDDTATRALTAADLEAPDLEVDEEADETLRRDDPGPEQTVMLAGESRRASTDTGTVIFRGDVQPLAAETRIGAPGVTPSSPGEALSESSTDSLDDQASGRDFDVPRVSPRARVGGYAVRLAALAGCAALFAILVLAVPLMRTFGGALSEESQLRARALAGLLAVANESALGQGRLEEVTVRRVTEQAGVTGAFVLDPMGRILAPKERAGDTLDLRALDVPPAEVRKLHSGRSESGELVVAEPVSYRGRRVGVAVVSLRTPSGGWPALVLLLGSALLLMGLSTAVLLTKRWTLEPVRELLEDVEALSGEPAQQVSTERAFDELSALAESVNRILERPPSST